MILSLVLAIVLFISVAMLIQEGLWSNALTLVDVIFAALVATCFWEPLAMWLENLVPGGTYLWDFVALWLVFCLSYLVFRVATDLISRVRVRFKRPVDWTGGILCAVFVGWVMVCFTATTLHTAPLAEHFLWGEFYDEPEDRIFLGVLAPDRQWLGFVHRLSHGSMAGKEPFDAPADFIDKYAKRRKEYETVTGIFAD